ncbi:response regulator transcription factor [Gulosibacter macacae]|uniref:response regulator transcription factor n=1 Tax=Gulosibacter macacae TaxID=2488791 RepID=UPI001F3B90F6|nr:response regulator transcription factor [Gulosibacter macacae]
MATLALFSARGIDAALPALALLPHTVRVVAPSAAGLAEAAQADLYLVDGTNDLVSAKRLSQLLHTAAPLVPVLLTLTEGGLPALSRDWGLADVILRDAGPGEIDARIRLLHVPQVVEERSGTVRVGSLIIDEDSYAATFRGRTLDLTYKEFELLRHLAAHPEVVFTRERLLDEVWGYDYYGGTRTVDVHVRRLRAKLGDHETVIGTVRNVGYRLLRPGTDEDALLPGAGDVTDLRPLTSQEAAS